MNQYLSNIYYDPKRVGSFGSASKLYKEVKSDGRDDIKLSDIKTWLRSQDPYTLHRAVKRTFKRNRVIVEGINRQFDADLADMSSMAKQNNGIKFLLIIIDVFSRYLHVVPLKSKTGKDVLNGFEQVFKSVKPHCLRTDKGSEFTNRIVQRYFEEQGVHHFVTQNEPKANYAERVIRTLKTRLVKYFTHKQSLRYVDVLPEFVKSYNDSVHTSIGMAPSLVNTDNERAVFWYQYLPKVKKPHHSKKKRTKKTTGEPLYVFAVGDHVRLIHLKRTFMREYDETYTGEVFKITQRFSRQGLPIYRVADLAGEDLSGTFYQTELQKINVDDDQIWKIDKVLRTRKRKGHEKEMLVRWLYFPPKFDSWVKESDLQDV